MLSTLNARYALQQIMRNGCNCKRNNMDKKSLELLRKKSNFQLFVSRELAYPLILEEKKMVKTIVDIPPCLK